MKENVLWYIWENQLLTPPFATKSGKPLEILDKGIANHESGPDFKSVKLKIGDTILHGDVELDLHSRLWKEHGHSEDPRYNNVILHVVLYSSSNYVPKTAAGREVEVFELINFLSKPLDDLIDELTTISESTPCQRFNNPTVLQQLGMRRVETKIMQIKARWNKEDPFSTLYYFMMEALGYEKNRNNFRTLATAVTLDKLRKFVKTNDSDGLTAYLLGKSNLIHWEHSDRHDTYLQLWHSYRELPVLSMYDWQFYKVRPTHSPVQRIKWMAQFLIQTGAQLDNVAVEMEAIEQLVRNSMGKGMYDIITFNVLLPFLYVYYDMCDDETRHHVLDRLKSYPPLPSNRITRYMSDKLRYHATLELENQGMIYLYKNWCAVGDCDHCVL